MNSHIEDGTACSMPGCRTTYAGDPAAFTDQGWSYAPVDRLAFCKAHTLFEYRQMTAATNNTPALRPSCETCGVFLDVRPGATPEQKFCGTWYDHPPTRLGNLVGHTSSVLLPSAELTAQLAAMSAPEFAAEAKSA